MVTIYEKDNCVQCDNTKRWLHKNNIVFETRNILVDSSWKSIVPEAKMAPIVNTPVGAWSGFRLERLKELIA